MTIEGVLEIGRNSKIRSNESERQPTERQLKMFLRLGRTLKKGVKSQKANQLYDHGNESGLSLCRSHFIVF